MSSTATAILRPCRSNERLALLVDRKAIERENKRLISRLKFAGLRQNAAIEDLDTKAVRGLDKALFAKLTDGSLAKTAEAIQANLEVATGDDGLFDGIEEAEEGRILTRAHLVRERSRKLVEAKKAACLKETGALRCEACGFECEPPCAARRRERGRGFIEVHHALPVHQLSPANSRMVHAKRPWLTVERLKDCVSGGEKNSGDLSG
jgi:predicted HNH restriction endonuclease